MHFPDLGECTYHHVVGWKLVAIGWLDAATPDAANFQRGPSPPELLERLDEYKRRPQPLLPAGAGWFTCRLDGCARAAGFDVERCSAGELFVLHEAPRTLYCAPKLITHYIAAHRYAPPAGFVEAVLRRPQEVPLLEPDLSSYQRRTPR